MRRFRLGVLVSALALAACVGPPSLRQSVLGYDDTISRIERELLLVNIGRMHRQLPPHFTGTSAIAATFDYRTNAGIAGTVAEAVGTNSYTLNLGASAAENPTFSIVPVQGEEFTRRILSPMEESKFAFLIFQGAPIDMVLRLMADGIEEQNPDGTFRRFVLNRPAAADEYAEFRRRVAHLAWLNAKRKLFVGPLSYSETVQRGLPAPAPGDLMAALDKGFSWRRDTDGTYALTRTVNGRVAITNYDPRALDEAAIRALNGRAAANPGNFVLVDVRPDRPGGDLPLSGAFKLRSLNAILGFVAEGIDTAPEFDVPPDAKTGPSGANPARALAVSVLDATPDSDVPTATFEGRVYAVDDTPWDRQAFTLLYQLFQMTVTDVSAVGVPITISK